MVYMLILTKYFLLGIFQLNIYSDQEINKRDQTILFPTAPATNNQTARLPRMRHRHLCHMTKLNAEYQRILSIVVCFVSTKIGYLQLNH